MSAGLGRLRSLSDEDAMTVLMVLYLNGFTSGAMSGVITYLMNEAAPPSMEHAKRLGDLVAHVVSAGATEDRLGIEEIRNQVEEILLGQDSGEVFRATNVTLPGEQP